jgi:hypothetical protein
MPASSGFAPPGVARPWCPGGSITRHYAKRGAGCSKKVFEFCGNLREVPTRSRRETFRVFDTPPSRSYAMSHLHSWAPSKPRSKERFSTFLRSGLFLLNFDIFRANSPSSTAGERALPRLSRPPVRAVWRAIMIRPGGPTGRRAARCERWRRKQTLPKNANTMDDRAANKPPLSGEAE